MTANAIRVDCGTLGTDPCAYRVLAEQLPDVAVFVFDRDLRFELATGAAVRDTGWQPEEILGRTVFELVPPQRVEAYAAPTGPPSPASGRASRSRDGGNRTRSGRSTSCPCAAPAARSPAA